MQGRSSQRGQRGGCVEEKGRGWCGVFQDVQCVQSK